MPFIDKLTFWANTCGDHRAIVVGEQQLDYAQLFKAVAAVAQASPAPEPSPGVSSGPVQPSGVAVIDLPTSIELVVAFCAAVLTGKTAMVMDHSWPASTRKQLKETAAKWLSERTTAQNGGVSECLEIAEDKGAEPFLLGLTSGTSGLPKAFTRTAASWRESFFNSEKFFGLTTESITLAPGPLAASMNLYALGESIHAGSAFVALEHFSADAALSAMEEHQVNRLVLVPTVLELLAVRGLRTGRDGGQLRSIVCAGSALCASTRALAQQWAPQARIYQYYGAAELGFVAASVVQPLAPFTPVTPVAHTQPVAPTLAAIHSADTLAVGPAFPGVKISIRDGNGHEVAAGEHGDIYLQSPYVCSGYAWGDDGRAFSVLAGNHQGNSADTGHWYTVHDQGRLDIHGRLHVAGRASDMIITAGANVYPHPVEASLAAACGATVVVAGIADDLRGQRVVAGIHCPKELSCSSTGAECQVVASPETGPATVLRMARQAASLLPAQQRPTQYFQLSSLPLTGSGKISRTLLAHWIAEGDRRAQRL